MAKEHTPETTMNEVPEINEENGTNSTLFPGIETEHELDLDNAGYSIKKSEASTKLNKFKKRARRAGNFDIDSSERLMKVSAFTLLYEKAVAQSSTPGLTGFIMHYGLNESGRMELFYQPWFAVNMDISTSNMDTSTSKILKGNLSIVKEVFYRYDSFENEFKEIEMNNVIMVENSRKNFKDNISIDISPNANGSAIRRFNDHYSGPDNYKNDPESAWFTFQEIAELDRFARNQSGGDYNGFIRSFEVLNHLDHTPRKYARKSDIPSDRDKVYKMGSLFTSDFSFTYFRNFMEIDEDIDFENLTKKDFDKLLKDLPKNFFEDFTEEGAFPAPGSETPFQKFEKWINSEYINLSGLCPPGCNNFQLLLK